MYAFNGLIVILNCPIRTKIGHKNRIFCEPTCTVVKTMFVRVLRDFCRRTTAVPGGENVVNRLIHVAVPLEKNRDRRSFLASVPRKDEGTEGEKFVYIDSAITK